MEKRFDVIGVENLIMDLALQINRLPTTNGMAWLKDFCWQSGGNASSAIVALSRLGASCGMIGTVGDDAFGIFCREDMQRHGVDISHIKVVPGSTTFCICLAEAETHGRSFLGMMGTSASMTAAEVDESYISSARAIHLSCIPSPAVQYAVKFARSHDVLVSLDAGSASFPGAIDLAKEVDILIMSEDFYNSMFDTEDYCSNLRSLLHGNPKIAIVTLGSKGCAGADASGIFTLPAFSSLEYEIVDTTGAGDVFHGGFLYAYLHRYRIAPWYYTVEDCARFASAVSYINCTTLGGRTGIPTLAMVDHFLATGQIERADILQRKAFYRTAMFHLRKE